jgi:hypothetical protein
VRVPAANALDDDYLVWFRWVERRQVAGHFGLEWEHRLP